MSSALPSPEPFWPVSTFEETRSRLEAASPDAGTPASRWYGDPDGSPLLVWIHGGAFIDGDLEMPESDAVGRGLADRGIAVVALEYRKALHGVRFPTPLDDVEAGWRDALRRSPGAFLGGASAGGALAVALADRLRGTSEPRGLALLYPALHADLPVDPELEALMAPVSPHRRFSREFVRAMHENYAGEALDDPAATPGLAADRGFPPLLVIASEYDDLRASADAFARDVAAAGGAVDYVVEPGTYHGHLNEPARAEFAASLDRMAAWITARA